ncbi:3-oxoacyl-ACP reductase FabG [Embleya sp. NPDC050154]|uniref:3-oxoacyl-ACP reductase FabG n=1 Tax=Embleya sp. NPDC050154 TaxID=3363988 RepID=UPI0037991E63
MADTGRPVAVVTGGSRGIGRAVVNRLAADGFDVAFCYRSRPDAAAKVVAEAGAAGATVVAHRADVSAAHEARALVAVAEARLGPLSTLVTCAGVVRDRPLARMSDQDWDEVIRTNLDGTYHVCRAAALALMRHGGGCILTLSSVAAAHGSAGQSNYAASKAGIVGFTTSLARELGRFGVRSNVVAPGLIDTDMTAELPCAAKASILDRIPLRRPGSPEEVADLVSFLASDRARYINGQVIGVDGGLIL